MNRKILPVMMLGTALFLAACGQAPVNPQGTPNSGATLTKLTVTAPLGKTQSKLNTQGLGRDPWGGGISANTVKVKVHKQQPNASGTGYTLEQVKFSKKGRDFVVNMDGDIEFLTMTQAQNTLSVMVTKGDYTIESVGLYDDNTEDTIVEGEFTAYGEQKNIDLEDDAPSVTLQLHTLAGTGINEDTEQEEVYAWFVAPRTSVVLDQTFDALFQLYSVREGYVPTADYSVEYNPDNFENGAPVLGKGSKLGTKIKAAQTIPSQDSKLTGKAKVTAWVETGEEKAAQQTFDVPLYAMWSEDGQGVPFGGQIETGGPDMYPPFISLNAPEGTVWLGELGQSVSVSGIASDVASIELYDGLDLVGTYSWGAWWDQSISFDWQTNIWTANWTPDSFGEHQLWAVVRDWAGNETRTEVVTFNVKQD